MVLNNILRYKIAQIVFEAGDGHIPSAYSILEILDVLYGSFLKYDAKNPLWDERDYFILSKGHGCIALYLMLEKYGFIKSIDLKNKGKLNAILGGHPDRTKIPGIEASTGSLGHGLPISLGIALGLRIKEKQNKVITLIGDGESNEGTIWESALVAAHRQLGNLLVILDRNYSTDPILGIPNMKNIWSSIGWEVYEVDGHNKNEILTTLKSLKFKLFAKPKIIIAKTIKGKGVTFMESNGIWHSKVPTSAEMEQIKQELI